jgi:uncharacterized protein (TIGR00299 family) protein
MGSNGNEIHAHFDCFGGATVGALLAACIHANDKSHVLDVIQTDIQEGLPKLRLQSLQVSLTSAATMSASVVHAIVEKKDATFNLQQIRCMLATAKHFIPEHVFNQVMEIFTELLQAENKVHGRPLTSDNGYFSALCIVEVVATVLSLHKLNVKTASCSPLPLGEGSIWTNEQGLLPIPSPVTLQLLIGMETCPGPPRIVESDLVTPTAAALLRVLTKVNESKATKKRPSCFTTRSIGVGVDGSESRILRVLLGESKETEATSCVEEACTLVPDDSNVTETNARAPGSSTAFRESDSLWKMDELTQLEANLDDMTAEALAFAVELLLETGALDAWVVPIVMKKGRAAHTLCSLCRSEDTNILLESIFRHTTTLGIRIRNMKRAALRRSFLSVQTPFSEDPVQVKVGYLGKEVVSAKAEHDDCARISRESNVPINQVADCAIQQAHAQLCKNLLG